ncbi:hypothetical protein D3C72_1928890 [compost metagenome]
MTHSPLAHTLNTPNTKGASRLLYLFLHILLRALFMTAAQVLDRVGRSAFTLQDRVGKQVHETVYLNSHHITPIYKRVKHPGSLWRLPVSLRHIYCSA